MKAKFAAALIVVSTIGRKHGNTLIRTLRRTYGAHFAEGCRDDEKLGDVLHKMDEPSLSKLLARSAENWTRFADMPHDERPSTPCRSRCPPAQAS
jgi:hypothetical protein